MTGSQSTCWRGHGPVEQRHERISGHKEREVTLLINACGIAVGGAITHLRALLVELPLARPNWNLRIVTSRELAIGPPSSRTVIEALKDVGRTRRLEWELVGVVQAAKRIGADAILNLANSGPLASTVPSVIYFRNSLYWDVTWLRRAGRTARLEAAARRALARVQMASSDLVVVPTAAMRDYILWWRWTERVADRIQVIPHGVGAFRTAGPRSRPSKDGMRLLIVGHGGWHKGLEAALDGLAILSQNGFNATLDVTIGKEGSHRGAERYWPMLVERAHALGVCERVRFLGAVSRADQLYARADMLVSPSYTEAFGFPVVEGMAAGLPVVASRIPASVELAGAAAEYFRPGDGWDLARAVTAVTELPPERLDARIEMGRQRAGELTWERNAECIATAIERQIATGGRR